MAVLAEHEREHEHQHQHQHKHNKHMHFPGLQSQILAQAPPVVTVVGQRGPSRRIATSMV